MKKIELKKIIAAVMWGLLGYLVISCEQVVDLDLGEPSRKLVVEGRVEKAKNGSISEQVIKLSVVSDFFTNQVPPAAFGADVWVEDRQGNRFEYTERVDGIYINNQLQGVIGEAYTLNIIWEGNTYQGTEVLEPVVPIDSIYQVEAEANLFEDGGIKLAINFTDPVQEVNFYFWETFVEGELRVLPDPGNKNNLIANDDFFDGQQVEGYFPNEELVVETGQQVLVRQFGLAENVYRYYFALYDQAAKTGSILDTPPAPVRGNIVNLDNPEDFPLGYFYATEVAERSKVITE